MQNWFSSWHSLQSGRILLIFLRDVKSDTGHKLMWWETCVLEDTTRYKIKATPSYSWVGPHPSSGKPSLASMTHLEQSCKMQSQGLWLHLVWLWCCPAAKICPQTEIHLVKCSNLPQLHAVCSCWKMCFSSESQLSFAVLGRVEKHPATWPPSGGETTKPGVKLMIICLN